MKLRIALLTAICVIIGGTFSSAAELPETEHEQTAVGFTVDLLPIALTAASGHAGFSYQTWFGYKHARIRIVGAQISFPDFLAADADFKNQSLTAGALIIDYVFGENFTGFWLGSGFELWQNRITQKKSNTSSEWINQVLTVGGGYIFPFKNNFYLEPWFAAHCIMNRRSISSNGSSFTPKLFSAEISLKTGYYFNM